MNRVFGYIVLNKDGEILKHKLNGNREWFPYLIFETYEEAKSYIHYGCIIKKVRININKKEII